MVKFLSPKYASKMLGSNYNFTEKLPKVQIVKYTARSNQIDCPQEKANLSVDDFGTSVLIQ